MSKWLQEIVKPRVLTAHKGDYGRILIVGGSPDYIGAPALAGMAAHATGADLVTIAAPEKVAWAINTISPDLMTRKLAGNVFSAEHVDVVLKLAEKADVVVVGTGIGADPKTTEALQLLLKKLDKPIIIDGDAFKTKTIPKNALITPHQKEFETAFGVKLPSDLEKRKEIAKKMALKNRCTILLKGGVDIITDGKTVLENTTHNPEMTVGGTGDTLAGITATFFAQSGKPLMSAYGAAWVNGTAGDLCLKKKKRVLASWMIEFIPEAIQAAMFH